MHFVCAYGRNVEGMDWNGMDWNGRPSNASVLSEASEQIAGVLVGVFHVSLVNLFLLFSPARLRSDTGSELLQL